MYSRKYERQDTEDRGQGTEDKGQRTRDRGQGTEDKGQRTRDRGQGTEDKISFRRHVEGTESLCRDIHTATEIPLLYSFSRDSAASAPISTFMCL